MIDKIIPIGQCTGCNGCFNSCPYDAISMETDHEGFWYPKINAEKCVNCGLCIRKCPIVTPTDGDKMIEPEVYACYSKNETTRSSSTSGGIFTEMAKVVIAQGGTVVGARYIDDFTVEHYLISSEDEIELLRQSKYLQSDIGTIYKQVKNELLKGIPVLFCGTPCQNAALDSFLRKPYANLVQCDFICRGVISPKVFLKYLDMLEKEFGAKVKKVQFKNKKNGWHSFGTKIDFENGKSYYQDRYHDMYMVGYLEHNLYMRPSCHDCHFKGLPRHADITLGDFWGIEKTHPEMDQNKGTSVVMTNSKKGEKLFLQIQKNIDSLKCSVADIRVGNDCLDCVAPAGKNRQAFFSDLNQNSFEELCKKYASVSFYTKVKRKIYNILSRVKHAILN